ncbi:MAG: D-alanine--D-alanine ligase [Gammaproteobacteria bacterium]|nr:D-alanine--D-alanine ligase [Gammaproteobacteria bacterium]
MEALGKVAVLMGGWSAERAVSLNSGQAVLAALQSKGVDAHGIDVDRSIHQRLEAEKYDRVFNILHGRGGEDGVIQGMLDVMQIPYTGSGVLGSALTMDKQLTKQLWHGIGLPSPAYKVLQTESDCTQAIAELGLPLMIKPVLEGSSIGMSKVSRAGDMIAAWQQATTCGGTVIAEAFVTGKEYTAAILNGRVLPMIRLETPRDFYDYKAKYDDEDTQYHCPCGLTVETEKKLSELVLQAFNAVHAKGWGRVDFMLDEQSNPWLIEVNTVPGMTDHSLVPMAAKEAGLSFEELVIEILQGTITAC